MEDVGSGEGDYPQTDDEAPDRNDVLAGRTVMEGEAGTFVGAKNLTADANDHEQNADSEGEPCHG